MSSSPAPGELIRRTISEFHDRTSGTIPISPLAPHETALARRAVSVAIECGEETWTIALEPIPRSRDTIVGVIGFAVPRGIAE